MFDINKLLFYYLNIMFDNYLFRHENGENNGHFNFL